jgi:PAS domain-containing protein
MFGALGRAHAQLVDNAEQQTCELTRRDDGLAIEIVARRRVEAALGKSEARFRRLADAGILGIVTADLHGGIIDANQTFLTMLGYTRDDLMQGKLRWTDLTPRQWRDLDERAVEQLRRTGAAPAWEKTYIHRMLSREAAPSCSAATRSFPEL